MKFFFNLVVLAGCLSSALAYGTVTKFYGPHGEYEGSADSQEFQMLPLLEVAPSKKQKAIDSITDTLNTLNKEHKSKKLAEMLGVPKDKINDFAQLSPEQQELYLSYRKEKDERQD